MERQRHNIGGVETPESPSPVSVAIPVLEPVDVPVDIPVLEPVLEDVYPPLQTTQDQQLDMLPNAPSEETGENVGDFRVDADDGGEDIILEHRDEIVHEALPIPPNEFPSATPQPEVPASLDDSSLPFPLPPLPPIPAAVIPPLPPIPAAVIPPPRAPGGHLQIVGRIYQSTFDWILSVMRVATDRSPQETRLVNELTLVPIQVVRFVSFTTLTRDEQYPIFVQQIQQSRRHLVRMSLIIDINTRHVTKIAWIKIHDYQFGEPEYLKFGVFGPDSGKISTLIPFSRPQLSASADNPLAFGKK